MMAAPFTLADLGEAAADAAEFRQRLADDGVGHAQFARHHDGGHGVLHIVLARHGQAHAIEPRFACPCGGR